ncbi:hypothetical protein HCUR_00364 [Holospora curviuscula]|uniref:Uncharacterized protein n=1 Tax=Holospora curviuscula TaxID=1082868 RepID=A0A2S5RAD9_9PROT|nr:hypothetical protein HCUR_00364 [Holospora curviuscula]
MIGQRLQASLLDEGLSGRCKHARGKTSAGPCQSCNAHPQRGLEGRLKGSTRSLGFFSNRGHDRAVDLGKFWARNDFHTRGALARLRNDFQVRRIHRQMTLNRTVQVVHPLALAGLSFLENFAVSGHRNLLKSILPQGGGQKELLPSLNAHLPLKLGSLEGPAPQRKVEPFQRSHGGAGLAEIRKRLNAHPLNGPGHRLGAVATLLYIYIMRRFRGAPIPGNAPVALRLQYPLALHLRALMEDGPHPAGDLLRLNARGMKYRAGARIYRILLPPRLPICPKGT